MYIGLQVKYTLFLSGCNETLIFVKDFQKYSNSKFHKNLFSDSQVVPYGQTDGQTDVTKLIVVFAILLTPPKNRIKFSIT